MLHFQRMSRVNIIYGAKLHKVSYFIAFCLVEAEAHS